MRRNALDLGSQEPFAIREVDRVVTKGRSETTVLYEALDGLDEATRAKRLANASTFADALERYRCGELEASVKSFDALLARDPADAVAHELRARVAAFVRDGPPDNWDGTYTLDRE